MAAAAMGLSAHTSAPSSKSLASRQSLLAFGRMEAKVEDLERKKP
jgi:hypothetical protein